MAHSLTRSSVAALLSALACAQAAPAMPALVLRAQVVARSHELHLGDLVVLDALPTDQARRLNEQLFGHAPMLGQVLDIERGAVQRQLNAAGFDITLGGAAVVRVRREAQHVTAESLCEAALAEINVSAAALPAPAQFGARCAEGVAAVDAGTGAVSLRAQAPELLDGRRQVKVELSIDGRAERVVRVPVDMNLQAMQWCAVEGVAAGAPLTEHHFAACRRPLQRTEQWRLVEQPLPTGRLRRALRAGDVLTTSDIADAGLQMRGDTVIVALRSGALAIESRGELGQDARVGDTVRVHLRGGEWVTGRLAASKRVEMEHQQ